MAGRTLSELLERPWVFELRDPCPPPAQSLNEFQARAHNTLTVAEQDQRIDAQGQIAAAAAGPPSAAGRPKSVLSKNYRLG